MLLLLLLSRFSHVRLCVTPQTAAHQALPSLGFSRQEHWSGLPFPSPIYESKKGKWSRSVMSNPQWPHGLQPSRLLCPVRFSRQEYWSGLPLPSPGKPYLAFRVAIWFSNPKESHWKDSWIFIVKTIAEVEAPILWILDAESWLIGKDWERLKAKEKGGGRGWDG